jgi:hypothetical protein
MLGQRWSVDLFVFRGSLVGVMAAISMVEGAARCVVAKVAAWQAWHLPLRGALSTSLR